MGSPQLFLLLWVAVWMKKPIGSIPGCAWRGGGSAEHDAVLIHVAILHRQHLSQGLQSSQRAAVGLSRQI